MTNGSQTKDRVRNVKGAAGDLNEKDDLEGKVIVVESWKENSSRFVDKLGQVLPPYLVFAGRIEESGEPITFSGGTVLDKQAKDMGEPPFRAVLRNPKGKRYWVFDSPEE